MTGTPLIGLIMGSISDWSTLEHAARILREAGYTGELRAVGDVLVDQLSHMRRCGFDAFAPDKPLDAEDAARAFATWDNVYQRAADGRKTIAGLRHE